MSLQPGSSYVNYLAVKKLLPLDDYANPYPSTTIFAVDSSGTLAGYSPGEWFSTIGIPNPSTLEGQFVSTVAVINAGFGSTTYELVSSLNIVNKDILTSSLTSTVAGLAATTGVSQAQFDAAIKGLGTTGYVSSTQLASTVAGLGTAGYLSTGADGILHVRALSTGSVSLSTLALVDTADPAQAKLLYNQGGGLYFGGSLLGGTITDLSLNTLDVSNATVYQNLVVGNELGVPTIYNNLINTHTVNTRGNGSLDRVWAVTGQFLSGNYGVETSTNDGASWDVSAELFSSRINNVKYFNGITYALGQFGLDINFNGLYYSLDNGVNWNTTGTLFENNEITDIAYNGSTYMVVGGTSVWTSTDGINWSAASSPSSMTSILTVIYNGTYWVIGGQGASPIQYSLDGSSWTVAGGTSPSGLKIKSLIYNGFNMVAINDATQSQNIFYSENRGKTWTSVSLTGSPINTTALSWNGTFFVVATSEPAFYYSRNGITWSRSASAPSENSTSIFWNGRVFKGAANTYTYESTDGITWTQSAKTYTISNPTSISYSVNSTDDIITYNGRYYGIDVPHFYDSTNQIFNGSDRLVLNNTLTIKDGRVGIMYGDPSFQLDIQGGIRASTLRASTLELADTNRLSLIKMENGLININNIPIVQSTVAGLGQTYVSIPSLTSTVAGLGLAGYISNLSLISTIDGLGTMNYVSSPSLTSTIAGLGTMNYVSSLSLTSTVVGLGSASYISSASLVSTLEGLGTAGYVSTLGLGESFMSTVAGLGSASYISSPSLTSTVVGLGTAGYVSTIGLVQSLTSTITGLGTSGYVSTLSLTSTVGSLLLNLTVSTFQASTITYAKLFTSTVYLGNSASTNTLRFYGVNRDGPPGFTSYTHTVLGERIFYEEAAFANSELLLFKGNDASFTNGTDRIRHLAGEHQFDIIEDNSIWNENQDPPVPKISGALTINNNGYIGINTTTPIAYLHVSTFAQNNAPAIYVEGGTHIGGLNSMVQIKNEIDSMNNSGIYANNALLRLDTSGSAANWNYISAVSSGTQIFRVDQSGNGFIRGRFGVGTDTPSYSLDVCGSFYASTINYAKFYTSTVYVGNDNLSTNTIRFRGTKDDGGGTNLYNHTVIGERIWGASERSELLLFKGNDGSLTGGEDRIRHFAAYHQFDVNYNNYYTWDENADPPTAQVPGALIIRAFDASNGAIGVNGVTPSYNLDVSGIARITGNVGIGKVPGTAALDVSGDTHISGNLTVDGSINSSYTFGDGTSLNPSITFTSDTDTGIYRSGINRIGFTTSGTQRFEVNNNGIVINSYQRYTSRALFRGKYDTTTTGFFVIYVYLNISSYTKSSTGVYSITFTSAMPDQYYTIIASTEGSSTNFITVDNITASGFTIRCFTSGGVATDNIWFNVAVF